MKQRGFKQGIFQQSSTKKEDLGTLRISRRKAYRYARCGGTAIPAGRLCVGEVIAAAHYNEAILSAEAIGAKSLDLTVTAGTVIDANELQGGEFLINDGTGEGHTYEIESNTALTVAGTSLTISLARGLKVALDTTSEFTLVRPPEYYAIQSTTEELPLIGVTPIAVTATYYFWAQTGGLCSIWNDGTTTVVAHQYIQQSANNAGAVTVATNSDVIPNFGTALYAVGVGEYAPCRIWIDGC